MALHLIPDTGAAHEPSASCWCQPREVVEVVDNQFRRVHRHRHGEPRNLDPAPTEQRTA